MPRRAAAPTRTPGRFVVLTALAVLVAAVSVPAPAAAASADLDEAVQVRITARMVDDRTDDRTMEFALQRRRGDTAGADAQPAAEFRSFSGRQFKALADSARLPNLTEMTDVPAITGDPDTDARIRRIAEDRGYTQKPVVASPEELVSVEGLLLQPEAARAYTALRAELSRRRREPGAGPRALGVRLRRGEQPRGVTATIGTGSGAPARTASPVVSARGGSHWEGILERRLPATPVTSGSG